MKPSLKQKFTDTIAKIFADYLKAEKGDSFVISDDDLNKCQSNAELLVEAFMGGDLVWQKYQSIKDACDVLGIKYDYEIIQSYLNK